MHRRSILKALSLPLVLPASGVLAQAGAGRPVRVIVPLPAGTSNDFVARVLMPLVSNTLGQPVIVENKPGANGNIGTLEVVRSTPNGQTLLLGSLSPLAVNLAMMKEMPFDPRRDVTPIAGASVTNHVLMVKSTSQVRTMAEFIAYAKERPGKVSVGSSTGIVQLQIATMNKLAGIDLITVPYKGTPATLTDVIGGVLDATLTDPGNALAQVKGGNLRAIAVSSLKRNPSTPDWPAISETLPGFDFSAWNALVGPAGLPREIVERFNAAMNEALKQKEVVEKLAASGTVPLIMAPDDLKRFMDAEAEKWLRLARENKIEPQ